MTPPIPKITPWRSKKYREWIATLPCAVPGCQGRTRFAHHTKTGGTSTKCDDRDTAPLCDPFGHHSELHRIGKHTFQLKYGINFETLILTYNALWIAKGHKIGAEE